MYHRIATTVIKHVENCKKTVPKCCPINRKKCSNSAQECWKCKIVLQIRKSAQRNRDMPSVYAGHKVLPDKEAWIFGGLVFFQKLFFRGGGIVGSSSRNFLLGGIDHGCPLLIHSPRHCNSEIPPSLGKRILRSTFSYTTD